MDLNDIHTFLNFITNKKLGTYFSPEENDNALERGQMDLFVEKKKIYAEDEDAQDCLSPFKATYIFTDASNNPNGLITLPDNYEFLLNVRCNVMDGGKLRYKDATEYNEDELAEALDSQARPVSILYPVFTIPTILQIQLYPQQPQAGFVNYFQKPPTPNYVYTQTGRVITYNQAASTQLIWTDSYIMQVMTRALQYLGVSVEDADVVQFTQSQMQNGK